MWYLSLAIAWGVEPYGIEVCGDDRACITARIDEMWAALRIPPDIEPMWPPPTDKTPPRPLTTNEQGLIDACDAALARLPEDPAAFVWLMRSGELLYRRDRFAEARARLQRAVDRPASAETERAALLLLDTQNILGDLPAIEQTAHALLARGVGGAEFRKQMSTIEQHAAFKRIEGIEGSNKGALADAFLSFAQRFPDSELASLALFNAAVFLESAGRDTEALDTRIYLLSRASADDPRRAVLNRLSLARLYLKLGRPAEAAAHYERLHPLLEGLGAELAREAQDALFNAAWLREELGEYDTALRLYRRYRALYPNEPDLSRIEAHIQALEAREREQR